MSKSYKSRLIENALPKKGFKKSNTHHKYYFYYDENGKKQKYYAYISNSCPEYSGYLLNRLLKELDLTAKQFDGVVSCYIPLEELRTIYAVKKNS